MGMDYKVAFAEEALRDVSPDIIAAIATDIETRLITNGIEGLIEDSSDVCFVDDVHSRCLLCNGPLIPDRNCPAYPEMLRCYATVACTKKNLYIVVSSELGRSLLDSADDIDQEFEKNRANFDD